MSQHIYKGRGAPTSPPLTLLQHYLDLDTGETYIARGTQYVEDWGTPMLNKSDVDAILHEFQEAVVNGEGLNSVYPVEVVSTTNGRVANIEVAAVPGKFVSITDPAESTEPFTIVLSVPEGTAIRLGLEFKIYNDTLVEPTLVSGTDIIKTSGSIPVTPGIQLQGVVTVKHVKVTTNRKLWLIYGDTTRNAADVAAMALNSAKLDGYTKEQIVTEARALANDTKKLAGVDAIDYATDAEVDDALDQVAIKIQTLSDSI